MHFYRTDHCQALSAHWLTANEEVSTQVVDVVAGAEIKVTENIGDSLGKPLFEMCCFHMCIARKGCVCVCVCVKGRQDGLGHCKFFSILVG